MKKYQLFYSVLACLFISILQAQNTYQETQKDTTFFSTVDYQIKAKFSIGGSSPLGMPVQIREIISYNPTLQLGLEFNATKWFSDDEKWGIRTGLRFEGKGMKTDARVKNYYTQIDEGAGRQTKGYFTGKVKTNMKNSYITFPVLLSYRSSEKWKLNAGLTFSGLIDKDFHGYVYEGTLREGTPIGTPVEFEGDARGNYDFSTELNRFQWAAEIGTEYKINTHLLIYTDLNWGLNGLFKKNFDAISFSLYSIYLNIGFGYHF